MKKLKNKIIAMLLSTILIIAFLSSMIVFADEVRPSCVTDHFDRLNLNSGSACPPSRNTCGYTAMSMLLSYYDSYWRDDFIVPVNGNDMDWDVANYNSHSDEIINTFDANTEYSAWWNWYNDTNNPNRESYTSFSIETQNLYFESYLLSLAREWNYHSETDDIYYLWYYTMQNILERYLYEERSFSPDQITVNTMRALDVGDAQLFAMMEQQILNGNPVILYGCRFAEQEYPAGSVVTDNVGAHFLIAYAVEGEGEDKDILLHTGWTGGEYVSFKTTAYKYLNSIIWLEINEENLPHQCTDAYRDIYTNTNICACQVYGNTHPGHSTHNYSIANYDDTYHWLECTCGAYISKVNHNLMYSYTDSFGDTHYEQCRDCDYYAFVEHNNNNSIDVSETHHSSVCACGRVGEIEEHYYHHYARNDQLTHYVYCECGHCIRKSYHVVPAGNAFFKICIHCGERIDMGEVLLPVPGPGIQSVCQTTYITEDGSYVDGNGIIYLVESDMALYLAGELDVYALAENVFGAVKQ